MQILLLTITIILLAASQVVQKIAGMKVDTSGGAMRTIVSLAGSFHFWFAACMLAIALVTWLMTLATAEVSKTYPILAFSFVLTAVASRLVLGETIGPWRWFGIALISIGSAIMMTSI